MSRLSTIRRHKPSNTSPTKLQPQHQEEPPPPPPPAEQANETATASAVPSDNQPTSFMVTSSTPCASGASSPLPTVPPVRAQAQPEVGVQVESEQQQQKQLVVEQRVDETRAKTRLSGAVSRRSSLRQAPQSGTAPPIDAELRKSSTSILRNRLEAVPSPSSSAAQQRPPLGNSSGRRPDVGGSTLAPASPADVSQASNEQQSEELSAAAQTADLAGEYCSSCQVAPPGGGRGFPACRPPGGAASAYISPTNCSPPPPPPPAKPTCLPAAPLPPPCQPHVRQLPSTMTTTTTPTTQRRKGASSSGSGCPTRFAFRRIRRRPLKSNRSV